MTLYSHSRISSFEQCPLKFKLRYLDNAEPLFRNTIEAFMGSMVHDALEKLYNNLKFQVLMDLPALLEFYNSQWDKEWTDDIHIVRSEIAAENFRKIGQRCITEYYQRYHPFEQERLIGCEQRIIVKFGPDGKYQLQGFIDRLSCDKDGTYYIHDYKTANNLPAQDYLDDDRQLALYSIAIRERYADCKDIKLVWHYLVFDKEIVSTRTQEEIEDLKIRIAKTIDDIESAKDFRPNESSLCPWCEYRHLCPNFSHLYRIEKEDIADNATVLVNSYIELSEKEKKIKSEMEKIRDAIYAVADKEGMNVLYGNFHKIRIWQKSCFNPPRKDDPLYPELIKLLKSLGRFDEVSQIDSYEFSKVFETWPKEIQDLLKNLVRHETVRRLYPVKR